MLLPECPDQTQKRWHRAFLIAGGGIGGSGRDGPGKATVSLVTKDEVELLKRGKDPIDSGITRRASYE
jgi:hypothetical protein